MFTLLIFLANRDGITAVLCHTIALGSMGSFYAGAQANYLDLCPNYSGALMGLVNGSGAVCSFLVAHLTGLFTTNVISST